MTFNERLTIADIQPQEFRKRQLDYFLGFAARHLGEFAKLEKGGILAPILKKPGEIHDPLEELSGLKNVSADAIRTEIKGWRNVSEHNLIAGVMADILAELLVIPEDERARIVSIALTHDWDKRLQKLLSRRGGAIHKDGKIMLDYDIKTILGLEDQKAGVLRVTGNDWTDYDTWGVLEKIMRYVDSSVGEMAFPSNWVTTRGDENKTVKRETILDWRERIVELKARNSKVDQNPELMALYNGEPVYNQLAVITEAIESEFYGKIIENHPEYKESFPQAADLNALLLSRLMERIVNTEEK